ncbi:MAG: NCS2 family permease [Bacteroidaceae bacterium]
MKILSWLGFNPKTMSVRTELTAGLTTFLTMSYILAVNPDIMGAIGMDKGSVFTATALSAAVATLVMAFLAKVPFALAPGMGINAFFAFTLVQGMGYSWETALAAVFIEGLVFLLLTIFNIREAIVDSIPETIRYAISGGIGLFIAFIGLKNCGLVVASPATFVTMGQWAPASVLAFCGIILTAVLMKLHFKGAIFYSIIIITLVGIPFGVTTLPDNFMPFSTPASMEPTFMKFDFSNIFSWDMVIIIFSLIFMDLFDTLGTLVGASLKANMVDKDGKMPHLRPALLTDSIGTMVGAVLGVSTVTTYVESTTGIAVGGRSGLTAATTAVCFLLALFFSPLFLLIPSAATTSALVIVGVLMMDTVRRIDFSDITESLPAFITIAMMPLTYSISEGMVLGLLSYVFVKVFSGQFKAVSLTMYILAILFLLRYILT